MPQLTISSLSYKKYQKILCVITESCYQSQVQVSTCICFLARK